MNALPPFTQPLEPEPVKKFRICPACPFYCRVEENDRVCPWCRIALLFGCPCGQPVTDPARRQCDACGKAWRCQFVPSGWAGAGERRWKLNREGV